MHYIGIDYHKQYSYIMIKNDMGDVEYRGVIENTRETNVPPQPVRGVATLSRSPLEAAAGRTSASPSRACP